MILAASSQISGPFAARRFGAGWRLARAREDARAAFMQPASEVMTVLGRTRTKAGFDSVTGIYGGQTVAVTPIIDMLSVRKLPALWMIATMQTPLPVPGAVSLMMRATGLETFSRFGALTRDVAVPADLPEACARSDGWCAGTLLEAVAPHLAYFRDGLGKELLITPRGLRVVALVGEGQRGSYLIFRDANFENSTLDPQKLQTVLASMIAVRDRLTTADLRTAA